MNLNQMYYYVAVCDCESFSKAAEKVFVSQPTLSKQIAALEAELGQQLIDRRKSGKFSLTAAGEEYLKSFRRILDEFEEANFRAKFGEVKKRRHYKIGTMAGWMLHDLIRCCTAQVETAFPDVELEFSCLSPEQMNSLRSAGALDLCLIAGDVYRPVDGYTREHLTEIAGMLYVSAKNPYVEDGDVHILPLRGEPLYSLPLSVLPGIDTDKTFAMMGGKGLLIKERASLDSIRMSILAGHGYGLADAWTDAVHDSRFQAKLLPGYMEREILLSRREGDNSRLTETLTGCIRDWAAAPSFRL